MSTDDEIFVLLDVQVKMTARVAYITRIIRITLKLIKLRYYFRSFQVFRNVLTYENWS